MRVATFLILKKPFVLLYNLHLEHARTDQGPQHTHHIPQHTHLRRLHATFGIHFSLSGPGFHNFCENWSRNHPRMTQELYKIIKIDLENECFLKIDLHTPKIISRRSHNDRKVTQNHSNIPKVTPTLLQSDRKVSPKGPQRHPHMPRMDPKLPQSHPRMPKITTT